MEPAGDEPGGFLFARYALASTVKHTGASRHGFKLWNCAGAFRMLPCVSVSQAGIGDEDSLLDKKTLIALE